MTSNIKNNISNNLVQKSTLLGNNAGQLIVKWAAQTADKNGPLRTLMKNADKQLHGVASSNKTDVANIKEASANANNKLNKSSSIEIQRTKSSISGSRMNMQRRQPDRKSFNFSTQKPYYPELLTLDAATKDRISVVKNPIGKQENNAVVKVSASSAASILRGQAQEKSHTEKPVVKVGTASAENLNKKCAFYNTFMKRSLVGKHNKSADDNAENKSTSGEGVQISHKDMTARGSAPRVTTSPTKFKISVDRDFMQRANMTSKDLKSAQARQFHLMPVDGNTRNLISVRKSQTVEHHPERVKFDKLSLLPDYLKPSNIPPEATDIKPGTVGLKYDSSVNYKYDKPATVKDEKSNFSKYKLAVVETPKFDKLSLLPDYLKPTEQKKPEETNIKALTVVNTHCQTFKKSESVQKGTTETIKEEKSAIDNDSASPAGKGKGRQQNRPIPTALSILAAGLGISMIRDNVPPNP